MTKTSSVALFVHAYPPARGGVERLGQEIAEALSQDSAFRVSVFTGQGKNLDSYKTLAMLPSQSDPEWVHRLKLNIPKQLFANLVYRPFLRWLPTTVPSFFGPLLNYQTEHKKSIHDSDCFVGIGFPTQMIIDAWKFSSSQKKPLVVLPAFHNQPLYLKNKNFQKVLQEAKKIICLSQTEAVQLQQAYQFDQQKIKIITFSPYTAEQVQTAQKKWSNLLSENSTVTIGYLGQLATRKGLQFFDKFIDDAQPTIQSAGLKLRVVLAGITTETTAEVQRQLSKHTNSGVLQFIENPKDVDEVYEQFDIFVHPSVEESFGIVNLEAIYHGLPVLVHKAAPYASVSAAGTFEDEAEAARLVFQLIGDQKFKHKVIEEQYQYLRKHSKEKFVQDIQEIIKNALGS